MFLGLTTTCLAEDVAVVTGSEKGTYYQFGLDLQKLGKPGGFNVTVHPSKGSVENIFAVYQRPNVQLGIVQSDVLAFVQRVQTDQTLTRIAKKTKMVFPLYNEEVHLVGRKGIADFDDLAGKRVAVGREGSGTYLTARLLLKIAEVTPAEILYTDTDEALGQLKAGRIDAMFYVAGYPVRLLKEGVAQSDDLAVIPITNKAISELYPRAEIPANTYPWQPTAVTTVAPKAVLMSFDFRRRDCDTVGKLAQLIASKLDWLQKNGHPKWNAVDLNYPLRGWEQYDCVKKYLGKTAPVATGATGSRPGLNPVLDAIRGMLED
jgi:TRAP transporter TAXI family solute receptor